MAADKAASDEDLAQLLYHEAQRSQLCGVHALNTLLQGPYFTEADCAALARELDRLERELMAAGGVDSRDYLAFMAQASSNASESGFFSLQVLQRALEAHSLECLNLYSPACAEAAAHPERQQAFICNLEEHWFTILRKPGGDWWDFNSLFPGPRPLSPLHLEAYLSQLRAEGYSIFLIQGELPPRYPDASARHSRQTPGRWLTPTEARELSKQSTDVRERGYARAAAARLRSQATKEGTLVTLQSSGPGMATRSRTRQAPPGDAGGGGEAPYEDEDLQRAIQASLAASQGGAGPSAQSRPEEVPGQDVALARALAESLQAVSPAGEGGAGVGSKRAREGEGQGGEGPSGQAAEAAEPEPEEGPGVVELGVRLRDGARLMRRFRRAQTLGEVLAWLRGTPHGAGLGQPQLGRQYPRTVLRPEQTIQKAGLHNKEVLLIIG